MLKIINDFEQLTAIAKNSTADVRIGSKYASETSRT